MIKKLYYKFIPSSRKKSMATRFTRSTFGNICCFVLITAAGLFSMLPLIYAVVTSFKPIDELLIFPPTFFVRRPTTENYVALPTLLSSLSVPLSRVGLLLMGNYSDLYGRKVFLLFSLSL